MVSSDSLETLPAEVFLVIRRRGRRGDRRLGGAG